MERRSRTHPIAYVILTLWTILGGIQNFFLWRHVFTGRLSFFEVFFAVVFAALLLAWGWIWWLALTDRLPWKWRRK